MKNAIYIVFILFISSSLLLAGCSSSKKALDDADTGTIPQWFLNPPEDTDFIYATSTQTSRNLQAAISQAQTDARAQIGHVIQTRMESMQDLFTEESEVTESVAYLQSFEQVSQAVVATNINGSRTKEQVVEQDGSQWRAYVLMEYPVTLFNSTMVEQIQERDELYSILNQSQAFSELEKAVEASTNTE